MKVYELKLQKGGKGVFKVSLVKNPAIESTLLKFSKESEEVLTFADEEKRIIYSVAMRPNKMIFRKDVNGEPANVYYTPETVEEAQINYFRNNGNKSTNLNHADNDIKGVFPFESWIVKDAKTDKATLMGMEVIDGDWVMGYKIDNSEVWDKYIKEGKLDGLSIEATNLEHIFKKDTKMNKTEKTLLAKFLESITKMGSDLLNPTIEIMSGEKKFTAPNLEVGAIVLDADGKPAINLVFEADEKEMKTGENGEILEAAEPPKPEPTEKEKELLAKVAELEGVIATLKADKVKEDESLETMTAQVVEAKENLAALQVEKDTVDATVVTMTAQITELKKKTPGAPPIPPTPKADKHFSEKPYAEMSNVEKMKFNRDYRK